MAFEFPQSPQLGDTYSLFYWNGSAWLLGAGEASDDPGGGGASDADVQYLQQQIDTLSAQQDAQGSWDTQYENLHWQLEERVANIEESDYLVPGDPITELGNAAREATPTNYDFVVIDRATNTVKVIEGRDQSGTGTKKYIVFDPTTQQVQLVEDPDQP